MVAPVRGDVLGVLSNPSDINARKGPSIDGNSGDKKKPLATTGIVAGFANWVASLFNPAQVQQGGYPQGNPAYTGSQLAPPSMFAGGLPVQQPTQPVIATSDKKDAPTGTTIKFDDTPKTEVAKMVPLVDNGSPIIDAGISPPLENNALA